MLKNCRKVNLILKRLKSVSGFLIAIKTVNLDREEREFDVQAALIRQTLAAPVLIISETDSFVRFKVKKKSKCFLSQKIFVPKKHKLGQKINLKWWRT